MNDARILGGYVRVCVWTTDEEAAQKIADLLPPGNRVFVEQVPCSDIWYVWSESPAVLHEGKA